MNGHSERKEPYKGIWVTVSMLVFPPILLYFVFVTALNRSFVVDRVTINDYSCICLGFGTGLIYQSAVILAGSLKEDFKALFTRIRNYFENLQVSRSFAKRMHRDDLKEDGIEIWIYILIIFLNFLFFMFGLINVLIIL